MPSKWIGCIHKGQVGKSWSPRENTHRYNPANKSCNAESPDYDMQVHVEFSMEPTKEDWPSSATRVRLPSVSTGAR